MRKIDILNLFKPHLQREFDLEDYGPSCPNVTNNTISSTQSICSGEIPTEIIGSTPILGGGSYVGPYTYQWQFSYDDINWVDIEGETSKDYQPPTLTETLYYRRLVKVSGCDDKPTPSVMIEVLPMPVYQNITIQTNNSVLVSVTVNATITSGTMEYSLDGITYQSSNIFTSGITLGLNQTFYIRRVGSPCSVSTTELIVSTPFFLGQSEYRSVSTSSYKPSYGNYKFDTSLSDFGILKERKFRKVNRTESLLKLRDRSDAKSIYPMLDEFGYTYKDFFIFKSTWDFKYHIETKEIVNEVKPTDEIEQKFVEQVGRTIKNDTNNI